MDRKAFQMGQLVVTVDGVKQINEIQNQVDYKLYMVEDIVNPDSEEFVKDEDYYHKQYLADEIYHIDETKVVVAIMEGAKDAKTICSAIVEKTIAKDIKVDDLVYLPIQDDGQPRIKKVTTFADIFNDKLSRDEYVDIRLIEGLFVIANKVIWLRTFGDATLAYETEKQTKERLAKINGQTMLKFDFFYVVKHKTGDYWVAGMGHITDKFSEALVFINKKVAKAFAKSYDMKLVMHDPDTEEGFKTLKLLDRGLAEKYERS